MRRSRVRMMKVEDFILHGHMTVPEKMRYGRMVLGRGVLHSARGKRVKSKEGRTGMLKIASRICGRQRVKKIPWMYEAVWGTSRMYGPKTVELDAVSTLSYGFLNIEKAETFLFRCKLRITDCRDYCGLLLKSNRDASRCLELRIESGMKDSLL